MDGITEELAYKAMFRFLEKYYELTGSDDVGALLGSMGHLSDGRPADAAMLGEWHACIRETVAAERMRSAGSRSGL
ncbi:hypothetical protein [Duganella guangzhouensis]|jgi:hypothetical protein|nr:hypothetical protein [Duganella guangzhouensis]